MSNPDLAEMIAMRVGGVVIDPSTQVPVVILRGLAEPRLYVPIFIGGLEATAIATVMAGVKMPRPMSHDLMVSMLDAVQCRVASVFITRLDGGTFYAEIRIVDQEGGELSLDARPSDAIALALRADAPIGVARAVVDEAGGLAPEEDAAASEPVPKADAEPSAPGGEPIPQGADTKSPGAKAALDDSGPRSFFGEEVRLEDLDPSDFGKYKM